MRMSKVPVPGASAFQVVSAFCFLCLIPAVSRAAMDAMTAPQMPTLSPLPGTGTLDPPADPDHFIFVMAGDNRPKKAKDGLTPPIRQLFQSEVTKLRPALVMLAGDTIYGKAPESEEKIADEYHAFLSLAAQGGVPVFNAPGNHELDDGNNVPSPQMLAWYQKYMGLPFGAFDYGNSHFIALNTEELAAGDPVAASSASPGAADKKPEGSNISPAQIAALQSDLDAHRGKAHVFVFMHHPIKPAKPKDGLGPKIAGQLETLLGRYPNVTYVVAAHEHLYYNATSGNSDAPAVWQPGHGPVYLVSGGAGAPLADNPGSGIAVNHYLVVTVAGDEVSATFHTLSREHGKAE